MEATVRNSDADISKVLTVTGEEKFTCSMNNQKNGYVSWSRKMPKSINVDTLYVITQDPTYDIPGGVTPICTDRPRLVFIKYHNYMGGKLSAAPPRIGMQCRIEPSATIGTVGINGIRDRDGKLLFTHHSGGIAIGNGCFLGPQVVIHRGVIDDTVLEEEVWVNSLSQIGHGCRIGAQTMIAAGVIVCGSAKIGRGCWIGAGTIIREGVSICDDVRIGMGSLVTKDIQNPGIWFGKPAKWIKDWDGKW